MIVCARVGTHTTLEIGERTVAAFGTNLLKSALKKALAVAHVIHARKMCYSVSGSRNVSSRGSNQLRSAKFLQIMTKRQDARVPIRRRPVNRRLDRDSGRVAYRLDQAVIMP